VWTPRRILILLSALLGFGLVYVAYSKFLGRFDGLPTLPVKFLEADDKPVPEFAPVESPTIARLREAFGDNCPEMGAAYPTRLEIRESGIVFAAGMPQIGSEPSRFVRLAPLSVATFGKPRPAADRATGEVNEINTLHSDEGILEFDRPIASDRDMLTGKAKLIGIEFRSNPDPHTNDPRNGRIVLSTNQRTSDPGRFLVVKSPGPLFYRTPDHPDSANVTLPNIWTNGPVEIVNRDNLPRPLRGISLPAVPVPSDDSLSGGTVADMIAGLHTPPPTVTATGLRIFMNRSSPTQPAKSVGKKSPGAGGYSGIREMILNEQVVFSLWIDSAAGFPGSEPKSGPKSPPVNDPSIAMTALVGSAFDAKSMSDRMKAKSLLRVRTLGPFQYDMAKNVAVFNIAPKTDPLASNTIEVNRFHAAGGRDVLVCQKLEIEFLGNAAGKSSNAGLAFKKLSATGSYVLLSAATEAMQASGTAIIYETDPATRTTRTTLHGSPLSATRGKSVMLAGAPNISATFAFTTIEPPPNSTASKITLMAVNGPGRFDMPGDTPGDAGQSATWAKSLEQSRESIGGIPLDRLTFDGDAVFADARGSVRLKGDVLKLWLRSGEANPASAASPANAKPTPHMLHALGHVEGQSEDALIEKTDFLTVLFRDVARPVESSLPPKVNASVPGPLVSPPLVEPVTASLDKPKPKPVRLSARKIDVTLHRMPPTAADAASQYEMSEARCDDRVAVFQEANDPKRFAVGLDIAAATLLLKKRANGHEMTVLGTASTLAKVRFENTTISGPSVAIDQPNNRVSVDGGGWLRMPSSSSLNGSAVAGKSEMTIHWTSRMKFHGERQWAEFVGQVQATQAPVEGAAPQPMITTSNVACHEMNVTFDRPIYFNQLKRKETKSAGDSDAKVKRVVCTPAAEDGDGIVKPATNLVLFREESIDRVTKKTVKATQVEAKLLEVNVVEGVSLIDATGPGTTRILQVGDKDNPQPGVAANGPVNGTLTSNAKPEQELKLTHVRFNGRLNLKDQKGILQTAVFRDTVRVVQMPSETLLATVDDAAPLPPRSIFLKCNDILTVASYKAKTTSGEEVRTLEAVDGAEVKTDDYIGMGHKIKYDGEKVTLEGYGDGQATLYRRQRSFDGQDYKSGNPLIYNTRTGQVSGAQSSGGQFSTPAKK
jgi:hypothetical protein